MAPGQREPSSSHEQPSPLPASSGPGTELSNPFPKGWHGEDDGGQYPTQAGSNGGYPPAGLQTPLALWGRSTSSSSRQS